MAHVPPQHYYPQIVAARTPGTIRVVGLRCLARRCDWAIGFDREFSLLDRSLRQAIDPEFLRVSGVAYCPAGHIVEFEAWGPSSVLIWADYTVVSGNPDMVKSGVARDTRSRRSPEGHPDMAYDPTRYEERQAANDKSREFAHRDGQSWTVEDDAVILQEWVFRGPAHRDEAQVAKDLARTIEACRNRAHYLRGVHTGVRYNKQTERPAQVCTGCWLELPATGSCPNCE